MSQGFTTPLAIPVPVSQGGTGVTTSTGTGSVVLGTSPTITAPNIVGITTSAAAPAGSVGELIQERVSMSSTLALTSNINLNIATITLGPGQWIVSGEVWFTGDATTTYTRAYSGISTLSAFIRGNPTFGEPVTRQAFPAAPTFNSTGAIAVPVRSANLLLNASTDIYLVGICVFSVSTAAAAGVIEAVRVR